MKLNKVKLEKIIFYLTLLFLPTQLGRHFWPSFSYISGVRVDYLSPTIFVTDIFIFSLFAICLIPLFKKKIVKIKLILLLAFLVIGIVFSKSPLVGAYGFIKLLEFTFLGLYISQTQLRIQTIVTIFAIGILGESILAIAQFFHHGSLNGLFYFFGERTFTGETPGIANAVLHGELVLRPYGTLPHPNVLAGYLIIAMAIVIFNFQFSIFKKIFYSFAIVFGTIALFLTMSRVAIVIWLVFIGYWILRKSFIGLLVVFVFIGSICSIVLFSPLSSRFTSFSLIDESVVMRQQLIISSLEMVKNHLVFGVGLNNFLVRLPEVQKAHGNVFGLQPVHNIYLLVLVETGVVGFAFFVWLILKSYQGIRNQESGINKKKFIIHNSKFIILSTVLVLGLFDHYFLTLQQGQLLFAFVLGFSFAAKKMVQY